MSDGSVGANGPMTAVLAALDSGSQGLETFRPIDVSIVTFNAGQWIDGLIESLLAQAYPVHRLRILVRDNGSTDDTQQKLAGLQDRFADRFLEVRIATGQNIGFGCGHNANLLDAKSDFFLVTNPDLTFERNAIVHVVARALSDDADVASWELRQKPFEHPHAYHPVSLEAGWSSSAAVLLRTAALRAVGGYEPRIFLYGEDVDLSYRLRAAGHRLRYVPGAVCWHYTYRYANERKREQFLGNALTNFLLRLRFGTLAQMLAIPILYSALWLLPRRVEKQARGLVALTCRFLADAPHFLATRATQHRPFAFYRLDYGRPRPGAFFPFEKIPEQPPLVSLITRTTRGRENALRAALQTIANQTYPAIEAIIVEDGSDTARALVDDWAARLPGTSVRYLALPKSGRCVAGNAGLAAATGQLIGFLDDDDLLYADHVETLVTELLRSPGPGAVYALGYELPRDGTSDLPWDPTGSSLVLALQQPFERGLLWHHNYLPIQSVLFRRELYDTHGGFDETLENLEDWDLWIRYSSTRDFKLVARVTSVYSVPRAPRSGYARLEVLDSYRAKVDAKIDSLRAQLTPATRELYAGQVERYERILWMRRSSIRRVVLNTPGAALFYNALRRVGRAITRSP